MTIKMQLHDGNKLRIAMFKNVTAGRAYAQLYINFYEFHEQMKWGVFEVFKDSKLIKTHYFGGNNV